MNSIKLRTDFAVGPIFMLLALGGSGCSSGGGGSGLVNDILEFECDCTDLCAEEFVDPQFGANTGVCKPGSATPGAKYKIPGRACVKPDSPSDIDAAVNAYCGDQYWTKSFPFIDPNGALKSSTTNPLAKVRDCIPHVIDNESAVVQNTLHDSCELLPGHTHDPLTSTSDPGQPNRSEIAVTPTISTVTVADGGQSTTFPPTGGGFVFETSNCTAAGVCDFIIPVLSLYRSAIDLGSQHATDVSLINTAPLKGKKAANGTLTFTTPVDFVAAGQVGPLPGSGFATAQPGQLSGTYNSTTATATLNGVLTGTNQSINISLKGTAPVKPPVAKAGADQSIACTGATVHLNGSASTKSAPGALQYSWSQGNTVLGTAAQIDVSFATVGAQNVLLNVTDSLGQRNADVVVVNVTASGTPKFTSVPGPLTVSDCTSTPSLGQPTATTPCGAPVTITNNAPAKFPPGATTVTWKATANGVSVTATQVVTVLLGDNPACCPAGSNVLVGTSNNDTITGTSAADCIIGLGGQDTLSGGNGNDLISGGEGEDNISGGAGNDRLFGGNGQNIITGGTGDDLLCGGTGDDRLTGDAGADTLLGFDGQDQLFGSDGSDRLEGGNGSDTLDGGAGTLDVCIGGTGTNTLTACEKTQ